MKYKLIWNTEDCIDGYDLPWVKTEEVAKKELKEVYNTWMCHERKDWYIPADGVPRLHEEQIDSWNYMIHECYCYLIPFNEETGEYSEDEEDEIWLTAEELNEIGWFEYVPSGEYAS